MNVEQPPVEFTKVRVAEIGQAWKAYAMSQLELAKEKTPASLKTWLKLERKPLDQAAEAGADAESAT